LPPPRRPDPLKAASLSPDLTGKRHARVQVSRM
jgi:hypothetical protein